MPTFNQTRVELKLRQVGWPGLGLESFNQTRVELKLEKEFAPLLTPPAFNQTRVELKPGIAPWRGLFLFCF